MFCYSKIRFKQSSREQLVKLKDIIHPPFYKKIMFIQLCQGIESSTFILRYSIIYIYF